MEHRGNGVLATIAAIAFALWQALPALVKAYLLMATARALLSTVAAFVKARPAAQALRENITHLFALLAIFLLWLASGFMGSEMSDLGQLLMLSSKLIALWFGLHTILEILDDLSLLGFAVPNSLRERLRAILRNGKPLPEGEPPQKRSEGGEER